MKFTRHTINGFTYLTASNIKAEHAFTTRYGEACDGKFTEPAMTALCRALNIPPDNVIFNKQVHGADVRVIADFTHQVPDSTHEADALITNAAGIALIVFAADCVPILLHDPHTGTVGAAHAGWRGTARNIAAAAVCAMENEYGCSPADIRAAIGPSISKCCFATDSDVAGALFEVLGEAPEICQTTAAGKYLIDLKEANRLMLVNAGVRDIAISGDCTACSGNQYWSHRKHGRNRGSQAAVIVR